MRWEARLTPNPILKVLSTLRKHGTPALLMGGQACILYGGAEHSFTNPDASAFGRPGIKYDERTDRRSWAEMLSFFDEALASRGGGGAGAGRSRRRC